MSKASIQPTEKTSLVKGQEGGSLGFGPCVLSLTKISVGVGLLALPTKSWTIGWANTMIYMSIAGWSACMCCITISDIIDKIKRANPRQPPIMNMEEMAFGIWGAPGQAVVQGLTYTLLGAVAILFMILIGSFLAIVLPVFVNPDDATQYMKNDNIWRMVMCCVIAPLCCLKDMSVLGKFSFIGLLASGTTIGAICYFGMQKLSDPAIDRSGSVAFKPDIIKNIDSFVAMVFGFGAQIAVPSCKAELKNPKKVNLAIILASVITTILYLIVCLVSFFGFAGLLGDISNGEFITKWMGAPGSPIINGIPESLSVLTIAAVAAVSLSCSISYPLVLGGMFSGIEGVCPGLTKSGVARCSWRTTFVLLSGFIACFFGDLFEPFLGVIASSLMLPLTVGVPLAGYWTMTVREEGSAAFANNAKILVAHILIAIISVVATVFGTYGAVKGFLSTI